MQIGIAGAGKEEEAGTEGRTLQEGRGEWRCALSAESGWLKGERREAREGGGRERLMKRLMRCCAWSVVWEEVAARVKQGSR